jgi:hypothetical protein
MNIDGNDTPTAVAAPGEPVALDIRQLTSLQLAQLGVSQIAYVKPVPVDGRIAYAIHAADGTPMALAGDRALAFAAILQHEMIPTLVH